MENDAAAQNHQAGSRGSPDEGVSDSGSTIGHSQSTGQHIPETLNAAAVLRNVLTEDDLDGTVRVSIPHLGHVDMAAVQLLDEWVGRIVNHQSNIQRIIADDAESREEEGAGARNMAYYRLLRSDRNSSNAEDMFSSDGSYVASDVENDVIYDPTDSTEAVIGDAGSYSTVETAYEDAQLRFVVENSSDNLPNITPINLFNMSVMEDSNTESLTGSSSANSEDTLDVVTVTSESSHDVKRSADKKERDVDDAEEEPPEKKDKKEVKKKDLDSDDDDGQTCSICLESWTNFGTHRLSSLKCGHLFGHSCITRWLSQKSSANKTCPTCKSLAKNKDLRFIYAKKVKMCDNLELVTAKSQLNKVYLENNKLKLDLYKADLHRDSLKNKTIELEAELKRYRTLVPGMAASTKSTAGNQLSFSMELSLDIAADDSCRVFAYSNTKDDILITQKISSSIFPGYGIRRVNCALGRPGKLTVLHPKMIRDVAYSERNNLLLTASLDKTAKLFCDNSNAVTTTLSCDAALWSCCWDLERPDRLYLGSVGGIFQYDIRQPRACVATIQADDFTPIVMLTYLPNGILSCHLNSIIAHRKTSSTAFESKILPLEGPLLSARAIKSKVLVSSRPNSVCSRGRHVLCDVDLAHDFYFSEKKVFYTGAVRKLLSRSCLMDVNETETLAIADNESDSCVHVWKTSDGTRLQNISSSIPVIDTCPMKRGGESFLATLSQRSCRLYKAVFNS